MLYELLLSMRKWQREKLYECLSYQELPRRLEGAHNEPVKLEILAILGEERERRAEERRR